MLRILFLFILTLSARAESPMLMLEKARQQEVLSDVVEAVELYHRVASNPSHALRWRAEATAGLARCHELTESYVTANTHYLNVIKEFGQFKALADSAGERILAISRILADDGGTMSGSDFFYFNDLVISLHGALKNNEVDLSRNLFSELDKHLVHLSELVKGSGDESFVKQSIEELKKVKSDSLQGLPKGANHLVKTDILGACIETRYEQDPGELFNPVMRWKDRLMHFLSEGNLAKVRDFAGRIENYLKPLINGPEGDERRLARHYSEMVRRMAETLEEKDFSAARRIIFEADQARFKNELMMAVYLEPYDFLPANHLPYLSVSGDWVQHALTHLETNPGEAKKSVQKAREVCNELQKITKDPDFKEENEDLIQLLNKVIEAIDKNDLLEAKKLMENGETE